MPHTPGPWICKTPNGEPITSDDWPLGYDGPGNCVGSLVTTAAGKVVAQVALSYRGRDLTVREELAGNRNLIAKAPEMLATLDMVATFLADVIANCDDSGTVEDAETLQEFVKRTAESAKGGA